jgi:hypothetical protein
MIDLMGMTYFLSCPLLAQASACAFCFDQRPLVASQRLAKDDTTLRHNFTKA